MSLFDGKPIGRIDLGPRYERQPEAQIIEESTVRIARANEQARIWRAIRATAEGTNMSTPTEDA